MTSVELPLEVLCAGCGLELEATFFKGPVVRSLYIRPCRRCIEDAIKEIKEEEEEEE